MQVVEIAKPDYTIKNYGDSGIFKIIKFKHSDGIRIGWYDDEKQVNNEKLDNNISRARSTVFQLALCNKWDWFVTFTVDEKKYNRYDLSKFKTSISQFMRDQRKKYDAPFRYLLIPEMHKDGAWHLHGLVQGIPEKLISEFLPGIHPKKLIDAGYSNCEVFANKFGFVSFGKIKDEISCAYYITKYISKDMTARKSDLNAHLYYASQGLKKAETVSDIYGNYSELDNYLSWDGDFCSTGYAKNQDWTFPHVFAEIEGWDINSLTKAILGFEEISKPIDSTNCFEVYPMDEFMLEGYQ